MSEVPADTAVTPIEDAGKAPGRAPERERGKVPGGGWGAAGTENRAGKGRGF